MHPNRPSRRVHSAEFKAQVLAECRRPGASVAAVALAHGLNTNVVHKWRAGHGLKRMGTTAPGSQVAAPALQFVPVELPRPVPTVAVRPASADIRIELQRDGLHVKLQAPCTPHSCAPWPTRCAQPEEPRP